MDRFTDISNRSLGDNLIESIKGMLIGFVLFCVAFPLLWWNEGRTDISTVAKKAAVVKADGSDSGAEGKLISVTGKLKPEGTLGDPDYLKPAPYLSLRREVEMFAWVETVKTKEEKKVGGGTRVIKTYEYDKKWTSSVQDSSDFKVPEGHQNPAQPVSSDRWAQKSAQVGAYGFVPSDVELPPVRPIPLAADQLLPSPAKKAGDYLFLGKGAIDQPLLGDVRISFRGIEGDRLVTLYGKQSGKQVVAYLHEGKDKLFRVVDGTHEEAIATLHGEHTTTTWILRLVGFLFMWFGLALLLGPVQAVLDIIPFVGSTSRALASIALFPIALVLAGITILTAVVAHNPIILVVVVVVFIAGAATYIKLRADKKKALARA